MKKTLEQIKEEKTQSSYQMLLVRMGFATDEGNVMCMGCAYGMYSEEEQVEIARRNPHVLPCDLCVFCNEPLYDAIKNYDEAVKMAHMSVEETLEYLEIPK